MSEKFKNALEIVLKNEGGLVDDENDPGGITNFGISLRLYMMIHKELTKEQVIEDIKNLTLTQAENIYYHEFWIKNRYEEIEDYEVSFKVFDFCVNAGARTANKLLQRSVRAAAGFLLNDDGIIGNRTLRAVNLCNSQFLLCALKAEIANYYRSLNKPRFINGWLNRAYS